LSEKDVSALWRDLSGADVMRTDRGIWMLAAAPDSAIQFLENHVRPVAAGTLGGATGKRFHRACRCRG
jgi:hypothetical protein